MKVTYGFVKPDAYEHRDEIREMIENDGFEIVATKIKTFSEDDIREHYKEHEKKSWFGNLLEYIGSGKTEHYVLYREDKDAILALSDLAGPTDATKAGPDTIRGRYGKNFRENGLHRAANEEDAKREIYFHFDKHELPEKVIEELSHVSVKYTN